LDVEVVLLKPEVLRSGSISFADQASKIAVGRSRIQAAGSPRMGFLVAVSFPVSSCRLVPYDLIVGGLVAVISPLMHLQGLIAADPHPLDPGPWSFSLRVDD